MKKKILGLGVLICIVCCFVIFKPKEADNSKINLRFNDNYIGDTITRKKTGLAWALSFLGAELPKNAFENSLKKAGDHIYELDIKGVGFNANAVKVFERLIGELKSSEEYRIMGGIDLGEFIIYTLGSSWHYYEITGAEKTFSTYKSRYKQEYSQVFPVVKSSVAHHHRLIRMQETNEISKMSFIAEEGEGEIDKGTFQNEIYEVFDIMKNGQLRFAIYDKSGNLMSASAEKFGIAGKPLKCMWCHEINIIPLLEENYAVKNCMTPGEFLDIIALKMNALQEYRKKLNSDIDFSKTQDHALMEQLYISYMEPSVFKLAREWGQNEQKLTEKLKDKKKHRQHEYHFLNSQMTRGEIKQFSPYATITLPDSIWVENQGEPNIFQNKK